MKKLLKWVSSILFILLFFHSCVYHYITHMSEEDESNTEQIRGYTQENPIASYAWSKKHGLVQYTFKDGTSFTRIDIGNP